MFLLSTTIRVPNFMATAHIILESIEEPLKGLVLIGLIPCLTSSARIGKNYRHNHASALIIGYFFKKGHFNQSINVF